MNTNRFTIKFAGESGQGINSLGEIIAKALKNSGYKIFGYREYPSLIRGGHASYQIDVAGDEINSSSRYCDVLVCLSRKSIYQYLQDVKQNGILIHSFTTVSFKSHEAEIIKNKNMQVKYINALDLAKQQGGNVLMANMVLLGIITEILGLNLDIVNEIVKKEFASKPKLLEIDIKCLKAGYDINLADRHLVFNKHTNWENSKIITGNYGISLGAINAGVRAYFSYPMTPASSILTYLAKTSHKTNILIKQAEDEITAVQMSLGAMHMGTRALTGTSGGGFDLMSETISLAGIIETPLVIVLAQRPGPATGLPTWTSSGDLDVALYAGHGEYPRIILAISDLESAYTLTSEAFNLAEKYQVPVILLTEKQIAEGLYNVNSLPELKPIERHLLTNKIAIEKELGTKSLNRYQFTEDGISYRWIPGENLPPYNANGDEHDEIGDVNEEAENTKLIMEKRMKKTESILKEFPEPILYGSEHADITFIGWGSLKSTILDVIDILDKNNSDTKINYLHYEYIYPLKTEKFLEVSKNTKRIILVENNYTGQLGDLITMKTGHVFKDKLLKYDGRPFFIEDILDYLQLNYE